MRPDSDPPKQAGGNHSSFSLLQYEISRVRRHLHIHGECPVMRERLCQLEGLLEKCAETPAMDRPT